MRFSRDKDVNRLVCELVREGWRYRRGGKHGRLVSPEATGFLTIPGSPSDHRTFQNMRRDVRRLLARSS
jgi:predicted RNase H-like nuclease